MAGVRSALPVIDMLGAADAAMRGFDRGEKVPGVRAVRRS